jgi:flavin-dependent thymidylate synthase
MLDKEKKMVKVIYVSPLWLISNGIRMSHDNHHLSDDDNVRVINGLEPTEDEDYNDIGSKDFDLIKRVGLKLKHESVLEHSLLVFEFTISRALLQELSRHRIGVSPTVKSTRYTLAKDLKNEISFLNKDGSVLKDTYTRASKYVYLTNSDADYFIVQSLEDVRWLVQNKKLSNDVIKYVVPEAFLTKGQWSFNLRSLLHLLRLRTNKDVLKEFRELSFNIIDSLPDEWKELVLEDEAINKNYKSYKGGKNEN